MTHRDTADRGRSEVLLAALLLAALLVAAGCAQGVRAERQAPRAFPTTVRITDNAGAAHGDMTYYFDDNVVVGEVDARPNDVWTHILTGYARLGLAPDVRDARTHTVGVQEAILRRTLAGQRISAYLGCGRDMTGELADRATIRLWLVTRLTPSATGGTQIRTELTANATDNDGTSRTVRPCSSNHRLETGLIRHVVEALDPGW